MNRSCTRERNMHVMVPVLENGSCTCDLQLTSASPHVNGTIAQGNAIKHEVHISISTYHAILRQTLSYTMPCPPGNTRYHAILLQAIPYTMPCPPGDIIYYAISCYAIPYALPCPAGHILDHAKPRQAIPYTMSCPQAIPCHTSPGHTIYYIVPDRPYHAIPHQTITYTMPYLARPVHTPCDAHRAIPFTMPCVPDHTYIMPCHAS